MSWPARADRALVEALRALPEIPAGLARADAPALFRRAELHGVAGVVHDAWRAAGLTLEPALAAELDARAVARELDHERHVAMLRDVGAALARAGLRAAVLKGALFGARFYPRPSARATSDIDLLVEERALEAAGRALGEAGYVASTDPEEARFRREGHHLHYEHPHALPLELHFHAYRGFGRTLPSEPLLARSREAPLSGMGAVGVLAPEDELVYLAVHAAAHRFVRLGWLLDLRLLTERMAPREIAVAAARAEAWGFARATELAAALLVDVLGVPKERVRALLRRGGARRRAARGVTAEPERPTLRSATRFVYTVLLCDSVPAAVRYASRASLGHARRWLSS